MMLDSQIRPILKDSDFRQFGITKISMKLISLLIMTFSWYQDFKYWPNVGLRCWGYIMLCDLQYLKLVVTI